MSRYKNNSLNLNSDQGTVKNLLYTINTLSRQCKARDATNETLERIRSIILLYRPDLKIRSELQVPELVMEALMPGASAASANNYPQITHNFNYKYDYNTNYIPPAAVDSFGVPISMPPPPTLPPQTPYMQPQPQPQARPQSMPTTTTTMTPSPPPPPTQQSVASPKLVVFDENEQNILQTRHNEAVSNASIVTYKRLIESVVSVSRKYILSEIYFASLSTIHGFDQLPSNDLAALFRCINQKVDIGFRNNPDLCDYIAMIIKEFYYVVTKILGRTEYTLINIQTPSQFEFEVLTIRDALNQLLVKANTSDENARSVQQLNTERTSYLNEIQSLKTNNSLRDQNLNRSQQELTNINNAYRSLEMQLQSRIQAETEDYERIQAYLSKYKLSINVTKDNYMSRFLAEFDRLLERLDNNERMERERIAAEQTRDTDERGRTIQIQTLQNQLELLKRENVSLQNAIGSGSIQTQTVIDEMSNNNRELRNQVDRYKTTINDMELRLAQQRGNVEQLKVELQDTKSQLESLKNVNENLRRQNADLKIELTNVTYATRQAALTANIASLPTTSPQPTAISEYNQTEFVGKQITRRRQSRQQQQQQIAVQGEPKSTINIKTLLEENERLHNDLAALASAANINQLEADIQQVKRGLERITGTSAATPVDILKLNNASDKNLQLRLRDLDEENKQLKTIADQAINNKAEAITANLNNKLNDLDNEVNSLSKEATKFSTLVTDYELLARAVTRDQLERERNFGRISLPRDETDNEEGISSTTV